MARNWVVLTADRSPHVANEIISHTRWDGYVAAADEVVYTDPVDVNGNAVDALWMVSGSVTLAAGVYTYTDPGNLPTLVNRQRGQIFDAYLYWRVFGRDEPLGGHSSAAHEPAHPVHASGRDRPVGLPYSGTGRSGHQRRVPDHRSVLGRRPPSVHQPRGQHPADAGADMVHRAA